MTSPDLISTRSIVQVRTMLILVIGFPDIWLITCGRTELRNDTASMPSIPSIVYCFANPLMADLLSQISNLRLVSTFVFDASRFSFTILFGSGDIKLTIQLANVAALAAANVAALAGALVAALTTALVLS